MPRIRNEEDLLKLVSPSDTKTSKHSGLQQMIDATSAMASASKSNATAAHPTAIASQVTTGNSLIYTPTPRTTPRNPAGRIPANAASSTPSQPSGSGISSHQSPTNTVGGPSWFTHQPSGPAHRLPRASPTPSNSQQPAPLTAPGQTRPAHSRYGVYRATPTTSIIGPMQQTTFQPAMSTVTMPPKRGVQEVMDKFTTNSSGCFPGVNRDVSGRANTTPTNLGPPAATLGALATTSGLKKTEVPATNATSVKDTVATTSSLSTPTALAAPSTPSPRRKIEIDDNFGDEQDAEGETDTEYVAELASKASKKRPQSAVQTQAVRATSSGSKGPAQQAAIAPAASSASASSSKPRRFDHELYNRLKKEAYEKEAQAAASASVAGPSSAAPSNIAQDSAIGSKVSAGPVASGITPSYLPGLSIPTTAPSSQPSAPVAPAPAPNLVHVKPAASQVQGPVTAPIQPAASSPPGPGATARPSLADLVAPTSLPTWRLSGLQTSKWAVSTLAAATPSAGLLEGASEYFRRSEYSSNKTACDDEEVLEALKNLCIIQVDEVDEVNDALANMNWSLPTSEEADTEMTDVASPAPAVSLPVSTEMGTLPEAAAAPEGLFVNAPGNLAVLAQSMPLPQLAPMISLPQLQPVVSQPQLQPVVPPPQPAPMVSQPQLQPVVLPPQPTPAMSLLQPMVLPSQPMPVISLPQLQPVVPASQPQPACSEIGPTIAPLPTVMATEEEAVSPLHVRPAPPPKKAADQKRKGESLLSKRRPPPPSMQRPCLKRKAEEDLCSDRPKKQSRS
ncbi:MAG: hypothetical protein LQ340_005824, partial [Diploschistes diacapsis]